MPAQRDRDLQRGRRSGRHALTALADEGRRLAEGETLEDALAAIVSAAISSVGADAAIARVLDPVSRSLVVRAAASPSPALSAEIEGNRFAPAELGEGEVSDPERLPAAVRRVAERAGADAVLLLPVRFAGRLLGTVELLRRGATFGNNELMLARLTASQAALAVAAFGADSRVPASETSLLDLAGDALAAGLNGGAAESVARLALEASGAAASRLWWDDGGELVLVAEAGNATDEETDAVGTLLAGDEAVVVATPPGGDTSVAFLLGRPPAGVLQLTFAGGEGPGDAQLRGLVAFGGRAADALRAANRARRLEDELEQTRALLAAVGQAVARLSLSHTLDTAVEQVSRLLHVRRIAVYLVEQGRLSVAAARELAGPHADVAEHLLELALGRFRARGSLSLENAADHPLLADVREAVAEAGIEAAHAVPLVAHGELIGLLAVYPRRGRALAGFDSELLEALGGQLAVAVQNARLHEQAKQLGSDLEESLREARLAARRLAALNAVSGTFAQSMSLETTLDALARTIVELLDVDAAVIRLPDARREVLVAQAIHVADPAKAEAVRTIFARPEAAARSPAEQALRRGEPFVLDAENAVSFGAPHALLVPFLRRGSTAVVVPLGASARSVEATMTLLSLDPGRPIGEETIDTALAVVSQAAFAVENARLYQQLDQFSRSMQNALLPGGVVELEGVELGAVYESSARLELGGDLYDYVVLDDGRLAVVLGDVTGHGVDAAADMAMAKFVFRSLVREHPEPADFLVRANDVICGEVAPGKFVTMLYLTYDPRTGELACGSAGHPAPRIVRPETAVDQLDASGLVLGIEPGQRYEAVTSRLEPGSVAVLFTDGVIEARRNGELYGERRLDLFLARRAEMPVADLAAAIVADCRRFAGGELDDDCAVVVIRRP
jgi:serine phosphatase RsbU (regulator of sigma subunit)